MKAELQLQPAMTCLISRYMEICPTSQSQTAFHPQVNELDLGSRLLDVVLRPYFAAIRKG
jgi:hypothetical protein